MTPRSLVGSTTVLVAILSCPLLAEENHQKPPVSTTRLSFGLLEQDAMPADWRFVGGAWRTKPLARPARNQKAVAAVTSDHHVAFPSISKTKTGALLVVYREGFTHASGKPDDGRVMLVRSADGGKTWSPPERVADDPTMDDRNAAISAMNDGTLCVIFDKYLKADGPAAHHGAWLTTSKDDGRTWSAPVKVSKTENVHTRSPAIDLGGGKWLVPYSESTDSPTAASFFAIFDPNGGAEEEIAATPRGQRNVADETAVVRAANGDLVTLIRSNDDPELFQCVSKDEGRTWSKCVPSGIPSQFTPADVIRLADGRLAATFSFRERRDERMVLSSDHGATWDVENSVDVFDGTPSVGGDRSYPASVQLDKDTIGTVIYETHPYPTGGHIWFITTPLAAFDAAKEMTLYQANADVEAAFALWPARIGGQRGEFTYRFTGKFGPSPHRVGLLLDFKDPKNYTALEFEMGVGNRVQLVECVAGESKTSHVGEAKGDWYQDGNVHRLGVRRDGETWVFTIDGNAQFAVPVALGTPCGIVVQHAAFAVYEATWPEDGGEPAKPDAARIQPWPENPFYWQFHQRPILLLGGSSEDNLFQVPEVEKQLDRLAEAGGDYVRCTMSWRDPGNVPPYAKQGDKCDLDRFNDEFWNRFERFLAATARRDVIVQIEVWATFDYYRDQWAANPFNPANNVNYTPETSKLPVRVDSHPTQHRNDFFRSVPEAKNLAVVLPFQERFVEKLLSHSLKYNHVLYCMDNETSVTPKWGAYWSDFIRKKAAEQGKSVETTEMWDPWDLAHPMHNATFDHPETYSFVDVSQNNHNRGQKHYDNALTQRRRLAQRPRPMNNVKIYGADGGRFGNTRDGIERFWRGIFAGCAAVRFHRPDSGIGISETALRMIRSAREVTDAVDVPRSEPRNDLLDDCQPNEAFCMARPGKTYAVFFTDGGKVDLKVEGKPAWLVRWYDVDAGGWNEGRKVAAEGILALQAPRAGRWVAVVRDQP